jgi:nitroreductase
VQSSTDLRELRRLERWFYRAPSAHNTQPWLLTYERDRIVLGFDPGRHLAAGDPTRRDLLLGLGAFVETVLITCAAEDIPVRFAPSEDNVGEFVLSDRAYETPFALDDINRRRTSRLRYEPGRVPADVLAAARRHLGPAERLHELEAREVWPLFAIADRHMYESEATIRELRRWLRLSKRHPEYHRDGLTYECLDLSVVEARALALLLRPAVYRLVTTTRLHRALTAASKRLLDVDGSVLVLERDSPSEILDSGRSLMRVWLELSAAGFYTHPLSQIIDHAVTERELTHILGLSEQQRVLSIFRVGRSDEPARSNRLA